MGDVSTIQLLAQDYAAVVAALQELADGKGHERRTAARLEVQGKVKVFPVKDNTIVAPYTCLTRDISFRGIGLFQARPCPRGSQFVVILPRNKSENIAMLCVAQFGRELADGLFNIGAAFVKMIDAAAFQQIEQQLATAAAAAQREAEKNRIQQSILM